MRITLIRFTFALRLLPMIKKRGGQPKYTEKTKMVSFRVPQSKIKEIREIVKAKLKEYEPSIELTTK